MSSWNSVIADIGEVAGIATLNPLAIGAMGGYAAATGTPSLLTPSSSGSGLASSATGIAVLLIVIIVFIVAILLLAGYMQQGKLRFYKFKSKKTSSEY